jgi:hypothetical protein
MIFAPAHGGEQQHGKEDTGDRLEFRDAARPGSREAHKDRFADEHGPEDQAGELGSLASPGVPYEPEERSCN